MFCAPATEPRIGIKRWSGYVKERVTKRLNAALEGEPAASREREESVDCALPGRNDEPGAANAPELARGSAPDFAKASSGKQPRPPITVNTGTGRFDGYAWGENVGWVHFKNAAPAYNVHTTAFDAGPSEPQGTVFRFR